MQELIIEKKENIIELFLLEDNKIVEFYSYDTQNMPKIGNIYMAIVKDINKNSGAIFIDYGSEKAGYIDSIDEKLRVNDNILVMLKKEETISKGAKFSMSISIAGKNIILFPNSDVRSFSRKIDDDNNKELLKKEIEDLLPSEYGYIVRTEADLNNPDEILNELKQLLYNWNNITSKDEIGLLYDANDVNELIAREFCKKDIAKIYTNSIEIYDSLKEQSIYDIDFEDGISFIEKFGLVSQMDDISKRKIWLKSSGFITIDRTEALTAIDVNSGKYLGNSGFDKEDICYKVNEEAALEVMRQLRLKNIGGIIVVDFIKMKNPENKEKILEIMKKEGQKDRSRVEVHGFSNLGLVEIARKKF